MIAFNMKYRCFLKAMALSLSLGIIMQIACGARNKYVESIKVISDEIRLHPDDLSLWAKLTDLTRSADQWNRYYAYSFLAELAVDEVSDNSDRLIPLFVEGINDREHHIRHRCVVALKNIGARGVDAASGELLKIVRRRNEDDITWSAAEALGAISDPDAAVIALEELINAAADPAPPGTNQSAPQLRHFAKDSAKKLFATHSRDLENTKLLEKLLKEADQSRYSAVAEVIKEVRDAARH